VWYEGKQWLSDLVGLPHDQIHLHAGLAAFLGVALLLRRHAAAPLVAWLCVAAVQAANEALDARDWIGWTGQVNWRETLGDTVVTLFWPTVLLLLWRPLLGSGRGR
jgi:hypothetical protein